MLLEKGFTFYLVENIYRHINNTMKKFIFLICLLIPSSLLAKEGEAHFGIDFGYGFMDIGADQTAQNIANLSGSTVTTQLTKLHGLEEVILITA